MHKNNIFLLLILFCSVVCHGAHTIYIIVPGTWAGESGWHSQGGDFFEALKKSVGNSNSVMTYYWSGKNTHTSREYAAQGLANLIRSFPPHDSIALITHSHGSNVGILASQILGSHANNAHKIHAFYAFGTPVEPESYFPDMSIVDHFYNFFSFSDFVQTVLGMFKRVYPPHERIANISVTINYMQPDHHAIHAPLIAHYLSQIPACFPTFESNQPGNIAFFSNKHPVYSIEHERETLLEEDLHVTEQYCLILQGRNYHAHAQQR